LAILVPAGPALHGACKIAGVAAGFRLLANQPLLNSYAEGESEKSRGRTCTALMGSFRMLSTATETCQP
jgi:hypothetical protein